MSTGISYTAIGVHCSLMPSMLLISSTCSLSKIFSFRAILSGLRFSFRLMNNTSKIVSLFYTILEVYTKFETVSLVFLNETFLCKHFSISKSKL